MLLMSQKAKASKAFGTSREDQNIHTSSGFITIDLSEDGQIAGDEDLKQAFSLFDLDQDGFIDLREFKVHSCTLQLWLCS